MKTYLIINIIILIWCPKYWLYKLNITLRFCILPCQFGWRGKIKLSHQRSRATTFLNGIHRFHDNIFLSRHRHWIKSVRNKNNLYIIIKRQNFSPPIFWSGYPLTNTCADGGLTMNLRLKQIDFSGKDFFSQIESTTDRSETQA